MPIEQGFKCWLDALYEGKNTSTFGIVKADHDAPLMDGWMAHTNYQLINTVGLTREEVGKLLENSFDFLQGMLCDPAFLRYHIHMPADSAKIAQDESPDLERYRRETVLDMTCRTPEFEKTDFYKSFRSDTVKHFKSRLKDGRIAVCGNYEVLFGNPYEFLVALTDETYEPTESLMFDEDEVCTVAFPHGETVLCARSPHITMGNLYLAKNTHQGDILTYFNLTPNIICVNAIENNIQQRLNGCDYDSDSMLVTNDKWLVNGAIAGYELLKVPVCKSLLEDPNTGTLRNTSHSLIRPLPRTRSVRSSISRSSSTACFGMRYSRSRANTNPSISITTSAPLPCCLAWRSTRQNDCTQWIPPRCSHACAITVRTIRRTTVEICLPSTSISWEMKAPTLAKTTLTLSELHTTH